MHTKTYMSVICSVLLQQISCYISLVQHDIILLLQVIIISGLVIKNCRPEVILLETKVWYCMSMKSTRCNLHA